MESLITANIRSRPTRTLISVLAVALGIILMLIVGGIATGTLNDYLQRTRMVGADFILQPSGSTVFYAFSGASLPIKLVDKLLEVPGVGAAVPVLAKFNSSDFGLIFGVDLENYNKLSGRLKIVEGRESLQADEVIVDELYAKSHQLSPGMKLTLLNHTFTVSAICRVGSVVRVFVSRGTLQELNGTPDKVTAIFIKADGKEDLSLAYERLRQAFPGFAIIRTSDASLLLQDTSMPGFKEFLLTVMLVSTLLSFMVILLAMYTTIFERTREIGILKSLGASRWFIVGMILKESVIICGFGVLFGAGASAVIRKAIIATFPTMQVSMSAKELLFACAMGLGSGALGAIYPAYKAARQDPVTALSYE
jgi:putative ABC transport system permease protein